MSVSTLTFVGNPESGHLEGEVSNEAGETVKKASDPKVVVVFLLPDGRWQEFELPRLDVQVADERQLDKWVAQLRSVCGEVFVPGPMQDENVAVASGE